MLIEAAKPLATVKLERLDIDLVVLAMKDASSMMVFGLISLRASFYRP